jgi:hypothetical protein
MIMSLGTSLLEQLHCLYIVINVVLYRCAAGICFSYSCLWCFVCWLLYNTETANLLYYSWVLWRKFYHYKLKFLVIQFYRTLKFFICIRDLKMCIYTDNGSFLQFVWNKIWNALCRTGAKLCDIKSCLQKHTVLL